MARGWHGGAGVGESLRGGLPMTAGRVATVGCLLDKDPRDVEYKQLLI